MIIKPNMKKMFKKANIASGNTVNIGLAPSGGGMALRLKKPDKYKSRVVDRSFSTAIKNANKRRNMNKPTGEEENDQLLQKSGFNIAAIEARDAGKKSFEYAGKEFPVTQRMKEDGDGMYRMETMTPMNPMGAVPLRRNEMPMAYKQKVVKRTAGAKAIPFTNKNAL